MALTLEWFGDHFKWSRRSRDEWLLVALKPIPASVWGKVKKMLDRQGWKYGVLESGHQYFSCPASEEERQTEGTK